MPPKITIKRVKSNNYPEKFTKEKHLMINIDRKNKPDITLERHAAKNKNTGEKMVTKRKLVGDTKESKRFTSTMTVKQRDAAGNKTKTYTSTGRNLGERAKGYKGTDRATFRATNKINKDELKIANRKASLAKPGMADAVIIKGGRRNAIKLNEAKREYMNNPAKYDASKVSKAMETGRGGKVQRVMRRDLKSGRSF
jgi:hypothetical protein